MGDRHRGPTAPNAVDWQATVRVLVPADNARRVPYFMDHNSCSCDATWIRRLRELSCYNGRRGCTRLWHLCFRLVALIGVSGLITMWRNATFRIRTGLGEVRNLHITKQVMSDLPGPLLGPGKSGKCGSRTGLSPIIPRNMAFRRANSTMSARWH